MVLPEMGKRLKVAERRMFAKTIVQSSKFLKMPVSSRELYFQLGMSADDEGVVEAWNVLKLANATEDDLRVLISKGYIQILNHEDMITYLTDWNVCNQIRKDRFHESIYHDLLIQVVSENVLPEQISSTEQLQENQLATSWQPNGNQMATKWQPSIGKVSIGKDSLGEVNLKDINISMSHINEVLALWNSLEEYGITPIRSIATGTKRMELVKARLKQYGIDGFKDAVENIKNSDFLQGNNNNGWSIKFDWFIKPNNFIKVLEGNYDNSQHQKKTKTYTEMIQNRISEVDNW